MGYYNMKVYYEAFEENYSVCGVPNKERIKDSYSYQTADPYFLNVKKKWNFDDRVFANILFFNDDNVIESVAVKSSNYTSLMKSVGSWAGGSYFTKIYGREYSNEPTNNIWADFWNQP